MPNKKIKWLIYTVLVGLIPILSRFIAWCVTNADVVDLLSAPDFVAFGLVLHISNINEIEHLGTQDSDWKTIQNGTSIAFIALYSVLLAFNLIGPAVANIRAITACSILLSLVSLILSYSVYHRISRTTTQTGGPND